MKWLSIYMDDTDYITFLQSVGKGNMSRTIKEFIRSFANKDSDLSERAKRHEFQLITERFNKTKVAYEALKAELEAIDMKRKQEDLEKIKREQEEIQKFRDIEHDTLKVNLSRMVEGR